jgi:hypothetical protein
MDLSLGTDILLDVARAAKPQDVAAATRRLAEAAGHHSHFVSAKSDDLGRAGAFDAPAAGIGIRSVTASARIAAALEDASRPAAPYRKFEAFVLQTFIEAMLPKKSAVVFGEGTAGQIWKSFLAEALAREMSATGGVGIAAQLSSASQAPAGSSLADATPTLSSRGA